MRDGGSGLAGAALLRRQPTAGRRARLRQLHYSLGRHRLLHLGLQLLQALGKGQQQLAAEHERHGVGEDCRGRRRAGQEAGGLRVGGGAILALLRRPATLSSS